jgi:hypothetical protein
MAPTEETENVGEKSGSSVPLTATRWSQIFKNVRYFFPILTKTEVAPQL